MIINTTLLVLMLIVALWTVMASSLIRAAIGLAVTSVIITILMFRLSSPIAAVFELSVCAGLITVIFVSTISLVRPLTTKEKALISKARTKRYWYLPIIVLISGLMLAFTNLPNDINLSKLPALAQDVRNALWNLRQLDLFGQIIIIIAGAIAIVVLFREKPQDDK